jgi:sugar phosphate isomerase/epimerase
VRVRLGIATTFAVKRWPRPADWAPIVRQRFDLRLVQHTLDLVEPPLGVGSVVTRSSAVRRACAEHDLEIHSTITGKAASARCLLLHPDPEVRTEARLFFHRAIAFTERIGGLATGGHVGALASADAMGDEATAARWKDVRTALTSLAMDARRAGLDFLLVENRPSARETSTMTVVRQLLRDGDALHTPIRLCLDLGHMCAAGNSGDDLDPYAWLRAFARLTPVVQVQQSDAAADRHWPFTEEWNRLGRIAADPVLDALGEGGAEDLVLMLEVVPPAAQTDERVIADLVASVDYWREALARRGLGDGSG